MPETASTIRVRFQDNGNPTFSALVEGFHLPHTLFPAGVQDRTVTYEPGKPHPKINVGYEAFGLVGFDLEFLNGDHKLRSIGMKYVAPDLLPRFKDQNDDDPWRARVKYVKLAN